jgi:Tfp pilus assembly protein PilF
MRSKILVSLLLLAAAGWADTIHFKNGAYIQVERAVEKGDQIEYWMGSTKYSIPKSQVERIEKGGGPSISIGSQTPVDIVLPPADAGPGISENVPMPGVSGAKHPKIAVPAPTAPQNDAYWAGLRAQVLSGDRVDDAALAAIEKQGNARQTSNAYFVAGMFEWEHQAPELAAARFEHAVSLAPTQGWLLAWYTMALEATGNSAEAASQAQHLTELEPRSAAAFRLLGVLKYNTDRTGDAVRAWKRAQELEPDPFTGERLEKAQRELEIEDRSNQKESRHFSLRYEGAQTPLALERDLLSTMEAQFEELSRTLQYTPPENIVVILYTDKEFFDITKAPSWASGLNDGKLRIPMQGVNTMTPALQHVLKHELTHSFIRFMARDRCPSWLNEGLAQMMEPRTSSPYSALLARIFEQHKQIPLGMLEGPFTRLSPMQADFAYAESLATVQYLRQRHGMQDVLRILQQIGSGETPEAALRQVIDTDYAELEQQVGDYLAKGGGQ